MFKNAILAAVAVATLSALSAPAFASVPQSLIPTSESDRDHATVVSFNEAPQSLIPTSESDQTKRGHSAAVVINFPASSYYIG